MTGYTTPDLLPYPDDYSQPADAPAAYRELATATQVALDGRSISTHTHSPTQAGITKGTWNVGTLAAGQEKQLQVAIPSGALVVATVNHGSTYLFVVAEINSATTVLLQCRNGTTGTTHNNVKVSYLIVK